MLRRCHFFFRSVKRFKIPRLGAPSHFEIQKGGPLRVSGPNKNIYFEKLITTVDAMTKEPMHIHALTGYLSILYLVHYPERQDRNIMTLDCGIWSDADRFDAYAKQEMRLEGGLGEKHAIAIATHSHPDHSGAAPRYAAHGAHVLAPLHIERYYAGLCGATQKLVERFLMSFMAFQLGRERIERPHLTGAFHITPNMPRLVDGTHIPGFEDWVCVGCHGHTFHMVGLFHAASGIFYAADLLVVYRGEFRAPIPVDDQEIFARTLNRLRDLPVRWLLTAHGGIIDVESFVGGWDFIIDSVLRHSQTARHSMLLKMVSVSFLSREASLYNRLEEFPPEKVRVPDVDPVAVSHLK